MKVKCMTDSCGLNQLNVVTESIPKIKIGFTSSENSHAVHSHSHKLKNIEILMKDYGIDYAYIILLFSF